MSQMKQIWQNFKASKLNFVLLLLVILIGLLSFVYFRESTTYISQQEYQNLLDQKLIQKAHIKGDKVFIRYGNRDYVVLKESIDLKELFAATKITKEEESPLMGIFFIFLLAMLMFYGFMLFVNRQFRRKSDEIKTQQIQIIKAGENSAKENFIKPTISNVKFSDVAGIDEVKSELSEIVDFLKNPASYRNFGIKLPKGVLMAGAPGVGKTLIAKAVAGEAGVPFFYQNGASFAEIYVGVGAKRVRELFAAAKANSPSIIFIDEIDAVGKARGEGRNDEREATLNELLTQIDGFEENSGVIVIGATNKVDMIDDALLRPGRFDRRIYVSLPNFKDRMEILKIHLKDKKCDAELSKISRMSVGFSGAGLATFVNEAAINAIRRNSDKIELLDFETVKNKVAFGKRKELTLNENEKQIQAYYQGAKALAAFWFEVPFERINLLEDDFIKYDKEIISKTELINQLKVLLSGHGALELYKGDKFNTSREDIKKAQMLAQEMVFDYAMSEDFFPTQQSADSLLQSAYEEILEHLKNSEKVLTEISKFIFVNECIEREKVREIANSIDETE